MAETIVLSRESRAGVALMKIENILHEADMELVGDIVIKVSNVDTYYYRVPNGLPLKGDERPVFVRKETKELGKPHEKWHNIFTDQHAQKRMRSIQPKRCGNGAPLCKEKGIHNDPEKRTRQRVK